MIFAASAGDIDEACTIIKEVTQWCINSGRPMWPITAASKDVMLQNMTAENFVVGKVNGESACAMTLTWHDPEYWPNAVPDEAGYIHKLCVKREFAGMNLPKQMCDFALQLCRKKNVKYLRLDTYSHSNLLCTMYRNLGFADVGVVVPKDGIERTQFQKVVSDLRN